MQPLLPKMTLALGDRARRAAQGTCALACTHTHTHCRLMSSCWVKTAMFLKKPVWQLESRGWLSLQEETRGSWERNADPGGVSLTKIWGKCVGPADGGEESSGLWAHVMSAGPSARSGTETRTPPPSAPRRMARHRHGTRILADTVLHERVHSPADS